MMDELIRYNHQANQLVIEAFLEAGKALPEAERLFSHILNAQHIWSSRINGNVPRFSVFQIHPIGEFSALQEECTEALKIIVRERNPAEKIRYSTFTGDQYLSSMGDILFHVINHSTYHRGQIALLFRSSGLTPVATDYILLKRQERL